MGRVQVCDATVCLSAALWPKFEKVELQHPVRDASDPEYSAFVDGLGDGTHAAPQLKWGRFHPHFRGISVQIPPTTAQSMV